MTDVTTATYLARAFDTPTNPFTTTDDVLRAEEVAIVVTDGVIADRRPVAEAAGTPGVVDLRGDDAILIPGLVDTHVHYPQVRAIGGLGMPLLDWLDQCALPEEVRLADVDYARGVARDFVRGLAQAGTTSALVFGSHFASAMDCLFEEADRSGLRITAGQVVSDRLLRDELHTTPERALKEGRDLIARWHGQGRLRYAVTPRFSLSCTDALLQTCAELVGLAEGVMVTTHLNENLTEVETVLDLFPDAGSYLETYAKHGLVGPRSVLAHNVHPTDAELASMGLAGATAAHCPTSNAALGSGLFRLRAHLDAGVRVALGSDVGAGTGFSLLKEGLQAYFLQQLRHDDGYPLTPAHLLHLVTAAGADALGLADQVGDLGVGKQFDAVLLRPARDSTFGTALRHARDDADALAKVFVLGTPADVAGVWVGGQPVS